MRAPALAVLLAVGLGACATVHSSLRVTGLPGPATTRRVPVFYALAPPWDYRDVGQIHAVARADDAHIDTLIDEAERRAGEVGADALVIHDIRTDARYVRQAVQRTCTTYGPAGQPLQQSCPGTVTTLAVEAHLDASAVRRVHAPLGVASPWPVPAPGTRRPPAGAVPSPSPAVAPASPYDLDDPFEPVP